MRRKLERSVQSVPAGVVVVAESLSAEDERVLAVARPPDSAPALDAAPKIRDCVESVQQEQGSTFDTYVATIGEVALKIIDKVTVTVSAIGLRDQELVFVAVPPPCPVLVRPHQAEREIE